MASRLGQHLLRAKSKSWNVGLFALYPCYFFICCLAPSWLIFGCYRRNSFTHSILITVFGLSGLAQSWLGGVENFRLFTMYHYPFKGLCPVFPIASMHQIYQEFNSDSTNGHYAWKTSCWIQILKLQNLGTCGLFLPII